jgi:hypothetical protein
MCAPRCPAPASVRAGAGLERNNYLGLQISSWYSMADLDITLAAPMHHVELPHHLSSRSDDEESPNDALSMIIIPHSYRRMSSWISLSSSMETSSMSGCEIRSSLVIVFSQELGCVAVFFAITASVALFRIPRIAARFSSSLSALSRITLSTVASCSGVRVLRLPAAPTAN